MVGTVTVTIQHAVYDTFSYQRGAKLPVDSEQLRNLLFAADSALNRSNGWFFEGFGDALVFGFEDGRSEGTKGSMGYFDLFVVPIEEATQVSLPLLTKLLGKCRVDSYTTEPEPERKYEIERRDRSFGDVSNIDAKFVARLWECHRRNSVQCRVPLQTFDQFVGSVSGSLSELSFISTERTATDYFDVVGDEPDQWPVEPDSRLVRTVQHLAELDRLSIDALPTYREELRSRRRLNRALVQDNERINSVVDEQFGKTKTDTQQVFERYPREAAKLMEDVEQGRLRDTDDEHNGGIASRVQGLVGVGDDGKEEEFELLDPDNFDEIDPEIAAIMEEKLAERREQVWEQVIKELLPELRQNLREEFEEQSRQIAREAVQRIDETRSTAVFEEVNRDKEDAAE
jgi:hypothetical protein